MHDVTAHRHRRRRDRRASVPGDRGGPRVAAQAARDCGQFCGNGSRHREPRRAARRFRAGRAPQFRVERYVGHVTDARVGAAAAERRRRVDDRVAPAAAARNRCWRVQLRSGRPGRGASPDSDAPARAERGSGFHESAAGAVCQRRGCHVRVDSVVLREEGICHRQSGSTRVL